jgi:hypothetical protein
VLSAFSLETSGCANLSPLRELCRQPEVYDTQSPRLARAQWRKPRKRQFIARLDNWARVSYYQADREIFVDIVPADRLSGSGTRKLSLSVNCHLSCLTTFCHNLSCLKSPRIYGVLEIYNVICNSHTCVSVLKERLRALSFPKNRFREKFLL